MIALIVLFQLAPYMLGWGFGSVARLLSGSVFKRATGSDSVFLVSGSILFYAASLYLIGVFFFVIAKGGGINDLAADPLPFGILFPHPTFLILGVIQGFKGKIVGVRKS